MPGARSIVQDAAFGRSVVVVVEAHDAGGSVAEAVGSVAFTLALPTREAVHVVKHLPFALHAEVFGTPSHSTGTLVCGVAVLNATITAYSSPRAVNSGTSTSQESLPCVSSVFPQAAPFTETLTLCEPPAAATHCAEHSPCVPLHPCAKIVSLPHATGMLPLAGAASK